MFGIAEHLGKRIRHVLMEHFSSKEFSCWFVFFLEDCVV